MGELNIQRVVKPVVEQTNTYELSFDFSITPELRITPSPIYTVTNIDLTVPTTMVVRTGSTYMDNRVFYTTWTDESVSLDLDDWTDPGSRVYLKYGNSVYMSMSRLLPSAYTSSAYELVSIDSLYISGDFRGGLLYNIVDGAYKSAGCGVSLTDRSGNKAEIYFTATVKRIATGEIITVTGSTADYTVSNSAINNAMVLYTTASSFPANGDMKGQVTMTETPAN